MQGSMSLLADDYTGVEVGVLSWAVVGVNQAPLCHSGAQDFIRTCVQVTASMLHYFARSLLLGIQSYALVTVAQRVAAALLPRLVEQTLG